MCMAYVHGMAEEIGHRQGCSRLSNASGFQVKIR